MRNRRTLTRGLAPVNEALGWALGESRPGRVSVAVCSGGPVATPVLAARCKLFNEKKLCNLYSAHF